MRRALSCCIVLALAAAGTALGSDWPQLLGPGRDGVVPDLDVEPWPESGPEAVWRRDVGRGFAGPAVVGGTVLLFHRQGDDEVLEAFDASSGATRWRGTTPTRYRDDFGFDDGPRAVPVVAGGRVFTVGAQGVLAAWRLEDGELVWRRDTRSDFSVPKGFFGVATSPLVVDDLVLLNVGGEGAGVVAFDAATGRTDWRSQSDEQSYSSPTLGKIGDRPAALFFTREGLLALDPRDGSPLARFAHKTRIRSSVNAATPLVADGRVFLSAEYGAGAVLLELPSEPGGEPRVVWEDGRALNNHYATSVLHDGVLYGFHGRQEGAPALRAVELGSGTVRWSEERFGAGSLLLVGQRLLILGEDGTLTLASATPERYAPLARAKVLDGVVRAYPALAAGRLYARGPRELVAIALVR